MEEMEVMIRCVRMRAIDAIFRVPPNLNRCGLDCVQYACEAASAGAAPLRSRGAT
jgi:hypothetical protein